jgi:hypothetical protein
MIDLVFGFGWSFHDLYFLTNAKMVAYGTGSSNSYQNRAELNRIREYHELFGVKAVPRRLVKQPFTDFFELADIVFLIGNSVTKSTYDFRADQLVVLLKVPIKRIILNDPLVMANDDNKPISRRILFIGSQGSILKGLHRLIHFSLVQDVEVIVVGNVDAEVMKLSETNPSIRHLGFVSLESKKFRNAVSECGFVYFDSASEGMSGSLAMAMVCGLIPIASLSSGVDMDSSYGYVITGQNYLSVIGSALVAREEELLEKRKNLKSFTTEYFNNEEFKTSIFNELKNL